MENSTNKPGGKLGGLYKPLNEHDLKRIVEESFGLLERSGMHVYSKKAREYLSKAGAKIASDDLTVYFPKSLVEDAIASTPSSITLCGRKPEHDVVLEDSRVYYGTGGTAIYVKDLDNGERRPSTIADVKLNARLIDALQHVHLFTINVFPNEVKNVDHIDVNRFYWSLRNTSKHIMGGIYSMKGTQQVVEMASMLAGGIQSLRERPFVSFITLVISPFKIDGLYGDITCYLAEQGLPVVTPTEPICGTTSPITLAGNVLVHTAETLGGVVLVQAVKRGSPVIAGSVGSIPDLRTMGIVTGAIERGMLNSATAQIAQHLELPFYSTAGNSDSKTEDMQAGIESAMSNLLVGMSGANYIHDAAGLFDNDLSLSYEKLMVDNEILGMCERVLRGIEVSDETLAVDVIEKVGPGGNFITEDHTVMNMMNEYFNPTIADRTLYDAWKSSGSYSMKDRARQKLEELMATHNPCYISETEAKEIRTRFPEIQD
ncbi:trimethylamine methyltransferase family protein [Bacteroidota bacterium]